MKDRPDRAGRQKTADQCRARLLDAAVEVVAPGLELEPEVRLRRVASRVRPHARLVGGIGVSNAVAAYIGERERSIATMRSLGATGGRILFHFLVQFVQVDIR